MIPELENFYKNAPEPQSSCLYALRAIILKVNPTINEGIKYGMPCFCVGKKPFCYLWMDKKTREPYVLVVKGKEIEHPILEAGTRSKMKIIRISPENDIPINAINEVLGRALALYF